MVDATPAPTPAPTPPAAAPDSAAAAGGTASKPWYEGKADAETIGHWDNKGWGKDDPAKIAIEATKAARELQKHFGVPADQLLKLPKDASDEAGWKAVHSRLGVPDDAKGYDFAGVKHADGRDVDAALSDALRASMLTARVPKDRAAEIAKAVVKTMDGQASASAETRAATLQAERAELQKSWGTNFEFNKLTAAQGARRLGVDADTVAKLEGEVGYAKVMEMFRKVGAGTTEATFHEQGQSSNPSTREGATARLAELQSDQAWVKRYLAGGLAERREFDNLKALASGVAA